MNSDHFLQLVDLHLAEGTGPARTVGETSPDPGYARRPGLAVSVRVAVIWFGSFALASRAHIVLLTVLTWRS